MEKIIINKTAEKKFDDTIKLELEKRLKREPLDHELKNADTDSDLVNEVLWQMVNDLYNMLESQKTEIATLNTKIK